MRMVVGQAARLAMLGVAAGLALALPLLPLLRSQLFGITEADPLTLAAAPLVLVGVALLAAAAPARRAMRVDPVQALRAD